MVGIPGLGMEHLLDNPRGRGTFEFLAIVSTGAPSFEANPSWILRAEGAEREGAGKFGFSGPLGKEVQNEWLEKSANQ